ncbi:MAG: orotate phosphoribosyltransferase [Coriobacteriales bacterium]|nr:orotate phosphoribosyltransferase [Coriobacteriales bacterium]
MTETEVFDSLCDAKAVREGHFVLTSGRHSDRYVQCARVLEDPALTTRLAAAAVEQLPDDLKVDLVAAPAVGGIIFGFAVAQALGVRFIFSEREQGRMALRRSFEIPAGARVLVVEDVVTTGGSVKELIELVSASQGVTVGVVSLVARGEAPDFGAPFWPLLRLDVESWEADSCPLCVAGEPVYSPGSRRLGR